MNSLIKFVNTLKKEKEQSKEKNPWVDKSDEKIYSREILDRYVNLDNSCSVDKERVEVRDLLYEYKDAFSLRDQIGPLPNTEVEIDIMEKTPFFIRPYHAKGEDKNSLDKEMKGLCYLGNVKKVFQPIRAQEC